MSNHQKQEKLNKINSDLNKSPNPLRKTATNAVPGEGNPDADIMCIGEAPGKNEDLQGRPFVGVAGRVLNELLEGIGLRREDVFITSIVKFRPPNNRDPKPEEILADFPYLERQIDVIEPKLIVCLGRHALKRVLEWEKGEEIKGEIQIGKLHGKIIKGNSGRCYFPVYHPAAALYGTSKKLLQDDFAKIPNILKKLS